MYSASLRLRTVVKIDRSIALDSMAAMKSRSSAEADL